MPIQPYQAYVNQLKTLIANESYCYQHACEDNGKRLYGDTGKFNYSKDVSLGVVPWNFFHLL
jgi:hypothetical protein